MNTPWLVALMAAMLIETTMIVNAQKVNTIASTDYVKLQPNEENGRIKAFIVEILKDKIEIYNKKNQLSDTPEDILIFDDRIEFKIKHQNTILYFYEFIDDSLKGLNYSKTKYFLEVANFNFIVSGWVPSYRDKLIDLRGYFIIIQNQLKKQRDDYQLVLFEPLAEQYRTLKVKPLISEEQRKYIVQANSFNEDKHYEKAIELYLKTIEVDQTSYPAAYSNLALLSAQINNFDAAIYYMKKYLLLEPEAADARSAQDKIYEWEARLNL